MLLAGHLGAWFAGACVVPALCTLFLRRLRNEGALDALRMTGGASRALMFGPEHRQLLALSAHRGFCGIAVDDDGLFHLSHRLYLSRGLDVRQRVDCALYHYGRESRRMNADYLTAVYGGGGLELWREVRGQTLYRLMLLANPTLPHEGAVSAVLLSGETVLCEMGFNWVCGSLFGAAEAAQPTLFIVRNQSVHHDAPALVLFRQHFSQHSPRYLCLAAVCGIVIANDQSSMVGIRHECQIAYEAAYADNFWNSYSGFWLSFGATALPGFGYRIAVPLRLRELGAIEARHRKRAIERRLLWNRISERTTAALRCRLRVAHAQPDIAPA